MADYYSDLLAKADSYANDGNFAPPALVDKLATEVRELLAGIKSLEKDAERYRWLCDGHTWEPEEKALIDKEDMDAYIDAAMAGRTLEIHDD